MSDKTIDCIDRIKKNYIESLDEIAELKKENKRLKERVKKAGHYANCFSVDGMSKCNCGYDDLLKEDKSPVIDVKGLKAIEDNLTDND